MFYTFILYFSAALRCINLPQWIRAVSTRRSANAQLLHLLWSPKVVAQFLSAGDATDAAAANLAKLPFICRCTRWLEVAQFPDDDDRLWHAGVVAPSDGLVGQVGRGCAGRKSGPAAGRPWSAAICPSGCLPHRWIDAQWRLRRIMNVNQPRRQFPTVISGFGRRRPVAHSGQRRCRHHKRVICWFIEFYRAVRRGRPIPASCAVRCGSRYHGVGRQRSGRASGDWSVIWREHLIEHRLAMVRSRSAFW